MVQLNKEDLQAIAQEIKRLQQQEGQKTPQKTGQSKTNSGACAKNEKGGTGTSPKKKPRQIASLLCKWFVLLAYVGFGIYLLIYLTPYILH